MALAFQNELQQILEKTYSHNDRGRTQNIPVLLCIRLNAIFYMFNQKTKHRERDVF